MTESKRNGGLLVRAQSLLLVIDVQERYLPHLAAAARLVEGVRRLIEGARCVGVPVLVTEQYPQGLGHTAEPIRRLLRPADGPIEKRSMSCMGEPAFVSRLEGSRRRQVVVSGIEAHACVNQTVHELLAAGFEVHLVLDAVTARFARDNDVAVERLLAAGAIGTTVESVLLEWVRTADAPEFRAIRELIRAPLPEP
jgi:nicotinamidase-related amidase